MDWSFIFFFESAMLGVGLAMDAFSVSLANGLREPQMSRRKICGVAGIFAFCQFAMPMIGWILISTLAAHFAAFAKAVPVIALVLLVYIGGKMLYEGVRCKGENEECDACRSIGLATLAVQGVATSIDALSVGFTIAEHDFPHALVACLLIAFVTFFICLGGVLIGRTFGSRLEGKAGILGGVILIVIGIEIFVKGLIG